MQDTALHAEQDPENSQQADLRISNIPRIKELLAPIIRGHLEEIFDKVGALVIERCKGSQFEVGEIWVGAHDIGIRRGIFIQVKIAIPSSLEYDCDREDVISDLDVEICRTFNDLDFVEVHVVDSPYDQPEHAPILERFTHPDLWRRVYQKDVGN